MWYCCVWQGVTHVKCIEVGDSTDAETFCRSTVIEIMTIVLSQQIHAGHYSLHTLQLKACYSPLSPVFSSSSHHSDGIVYVALEVSQNGLSCCWVTELQVGFTTSLRTVGHMGHVEAVRNWTWTSPLPCHSDTWGIYELSSDLIGGWRGWGDIVKQINPVSIRQV